MILSKDDQSQVPGTVQQLQGSADLTIGKAVQCQVSLIEYKERYGQLNPFSPLPLPPPSLTYSEMVH